MSPGVRGLARRLRRPTPSPPTPPLCAPQCACAPHPGGSERVKKERGGAKPAPMGRACLPSGPLAPPARRAHPLTCARAPAPWQQRSRATRVPPRRRSSPACAGGAPPGLAPPRRSRRDTRAAARCTHARRQRRGGWRCCEARSACTWTLLPPPPLGGGACQRARSGANTPTFCRGEKLGVLLLEEGGWGGAQQQARRGSRPRCSLHAGAGASLVPFPSRWPCC